MEQDKKAQRHLRRAFSSLAESSTPQGQLCLATELTLSLSVTPHQEGKGTVSCPSFRLSPLSEPPVSSAALEPFKKPGRWGAPPPAPLLDTLALGLPSCLPAPGQDPELRVSPSAWHRDLPVLTCCLGAGGVVSTCKSVPITTTTVPYP